MNRNTANPLKKRDPSTKAGVTKAPTTKNSSSIGSKEPRAVQSAASGLKRPSQQAKPAERHSFSAHNDSPGEFLNNAVYDYLLKMGMTKTVEAFKDEVHRLGPSRNEVDANVANQLLEAFDKGSRELFFSKWNKLVPLSKRQKDEECNKLEFYLHVHFMAYSLNAGKYKPGEALTNEEVISFKEYLDNNGRDLAQTTEFLQYYALPYVPNPAQHASFKHLFAKDWVVGLRNKLEAFLNGMPSGGQVSALHQMYQVYTNQVSKDGGNKNTVGNQSVDDYAKVIAQLEASNQDLMNILQEYNEKYGNLTREYQILQKNEEMARNHLFESHTKWMAFLKELLNVTNDLVSVVDSQSKGSQVGIRIIDELKKRVQKYDNFLNANLNDLFDQSQDISTFEKFSTSQDITPEHSSIMSIGYRPRPEERIVVTQPYVILNFEKIKSYILGNSSNKLMQCSLLQALRWRITRFSKALRMIVIENRTRGASMRREVIISYSKSDVLDVRRQHPCILDALFINQTRQVCEFSTRFINALTSDYYGRTYLLETDKIVSLLINLFIKEKGDTVIRRNCLGALQKLSLRKKPQLIMIEKDIIKWILHALKNEKDHLGEYFYEYATALLMNLSLRSSGKKKCEDSDIDVLGMLNDLLEHENMQVRSFVNGTLYSLLSNPLFKEQAQAMGMEEILKYLMENADERYKKQIHYIIQRLNSDVPDEDAQSDANDEDNDYDDMEDEDEVGEDDDIEDTIEDPNIMVGEDLLRQYFSLTGPEAQRQNSIIHEIMEETKSFKDTTLLRQHSDLGTPLNRPTTPLMLSKITQQQTGMSQIEGLHTPDEFRAKPRVLRTPNGPPEGGHYDFQRILPNTSERVSQELRPNRVDPVADNRQSFNDIQGFVPHTRISAEGLPHNEKEQPASDPNLPEAFNAKPRLLRTPPDNKQIKSNNFFNY